jgi:hypothetical protein
MAIALSAAGFKNAISLSHLVLSKVSRTTFEPSSLLVIEIAFDAVRFVVPRLTNSIVNKLWGSSYAFLDMKKPNDPHPEALTNGSRLFRCSVCAKKFESLHRTTELATG